VVVLNAKPAIMKKLVFDKQLYKIPFKTMAELHERPLKFLNDFRPRSRYVWWTYLNAITQMSWRESVPAPRES
jgi:hypothetical protein